MSWRDAILRGRRVPWDPSSVGSRHVAIGRKGKFEGERWQRVTGGGRRLARSGCAGWLEAGRRAPSVWGEDGE